MPTKIEQFFADLDGGVFEQKLSAILSDVAGAVIDHKKQGEVEIKLIMKQIPNSHQVQIEHKLKYKRPTLRGTSSEDESTSTPMHVGSRGALTFFPENQGVMFDKGGKVTANTFPNKAES